jgi:hypothetical protein
MATGQHGVTVRTIRVQLVVNRDTGLLVALSDDLKGLVIAAASKEEVEQQIPGAIRELLEAEGRTVLSVTAEVEPKDLPSGFSSASIIASARMAAQTAAPPQFPLTLGKSSTAVASAASGSGTDLRFQLGKGIVVQILAKEELGVPELDKLLKLITTQKEVLAPMAAQTSSPGSPTPEGDAIQEPEKSH